MKNRIRKIRRDLDLTQQEFAAKIGIKRNTIANYETGRNDPVDSVISLICREFNVNEEWLRTGAGEMFRPKPSDALERLAAENGFSRADYALVEKFVSMRPQEREELLGKVFDFLHEIDAALADSDPSSAALPDPAATPAEKTVEELEDEYKKSRSKKAWSSGSDASSTIGGGRTGTDD